MLFLFGEYGDHLEGSSKQIPGPYVRASDWWKAMNLPFQLLAVWY